MQNRIGFNPGTLLSSEQVLQFSKLADRVSYVDSIWIPESWGREAFTTLGAISQLTNRVRLGTSIASIFARTPATMAMAASTLDLLSENRTVIGLGASTPALVENWHGLEFKNPVGRMEEYIYCIRKILTGENVIFTGKHFKIKNFKILYVPQRKYIPVFVAAVNQHMLSLAASIADGVLLYLRPDEELRKAVSFIRNNLKNSNRQNFEIACVFIFAVSDENPDLARERAAKTLAFYVSVGKYYNRFLSENGFRNEVQEIVSAYKKGGGEEAAKAVTDKMLDSITISGTKEHCIKQLQKFMSAGITLPILQTNPVGKAESSIREMLSTF